LLLEKIDAELADEARAGGCAACGGRLDSARYPRKPRGGPADLGGGYDRRHSFCCAVDGCRKRTTPPSVRFLGRRVYLGAVVVLAAAMQHGVTPWRAATLGRLLGVSRRTLRRWCAWWQRALAESRFYASLRARFMPPLDATALPATLLARVDDGGDGARGALVAVLRLLGPITTRPGLGASAP
jgi:hypothetical protein